MIRAALVAVACAASLVPAAAASAADDPNGRPLGGLATATQNTFTHTLSVTGWAYDSRRSAASIDVSIWVDGTYAGHLLANHNSPGLDAARHISGNHTFRFTRTWTHTATTILLRLTGTYLVLGKRSVTHFQPGPGDRVIIVAKRYVGRSPYVEGGTTPSGFDCSGYTKYAYAQAHVRTLARTAEGQRTMSSMRRISAASARPGDLVFYMSGGYAYHVAIYAGHGMQYAAATVRDGIRYQPVWSSAVQYRTDWH